jgi:hypothetical protein
MGVPDADPETPLRSLARPARTAAQLTQLEHVLKRPDTYIGSVEPVTQPMWVYDQELEKMVYRCVIPFLLLRPPPLAHANQVRTLHGDEAEIF